jgi:hypothetical protein|tara:strand:+ start:268 stop:567 length:300 start_codon:yes stop_codon:yes gene_type:complete
LAQSFTSSTNRKRITAAKGLSNELLAAAHFAKDPNIVVFTPIGGGPIDILTLNITTGEYKAWDIKTRNYRKDGSKINRGRTKEQARLKVEILNFEADDY